jgi:hypothetical protein
MAVIVWLFPAIECTRLRTACSYHALRFRLSATETGQEGQRPNEPSRLHDGGDGDQQSAAERNVWGLTRSSIEATLSHGTPLLGVEAFYSYHESTCFRGLSLPSLVPFDMH